MTMTEANGSAAGRPADRAASAAHAIEENQKTPAVAPPTPQGGVPYTVPQPPAVIDAEIWPGIATVPGGFKAGVAARIAQGIFRTAIRGLPLEVRYPDGKVLGTAPAGAPVMTINRPDDFARRMGHGGLIGLGEAYMAGDWDAEDLTAVMEVFASRAGTLIPEPLQKMRALFLPRQPRKERNTEENTRSNISRHYDLSNELFATFLDDTMSYSSALFPASGSAVKDMAWDGFAAAQQAKIDRLLDKAAVGPGTRVLEIGTGWGELALRAAARGATVYSVTLSSEQQELARKRVADAGYADAVTIDLKDYRAVEGEYDAIVSVEMIEAVGYQYWATYFQTIERVLAPGGKVAIQAITIAHDRLLATRTGYTWVHKYIFPGGVIPSVRAIEEITEKQTGLQVRERTAFGEHYAETLRLWEERFMGRQDEVRELGFDAIFQRMWLFYLCYSRAGFASGYLNVQQIVLDSRKPVPSLGASA
ncbi:cyclopropane-fatty-acyl-phospholipid synthase family protein [Pseudarthrobacter sp. PS3-L1]|uniref:SAM-dependent methyltransferase n=1 Tax=Pseudarthrobacter sp. PS3-L1 TaxID=3046207 RepID=UPI0024BA5281|nr:cyclopropane-fatty-acyl-phospholipid synthase family protein [Pseudarthrobacter sp. PS3-L1]MDJ0319979.1 cyclopropane-fatty-acyl-phospholipid synthase family protein [Pseudarthrobacter sp. PS3-L1]